MFTQSCPHVHLYLLLDGIFGKGGPQSWLYIEDYLMRINSSWSNRIRDIVCLIPFRHPGQLSERLREPLI